jgi:hypothetical protein
MQYNVAVACCKVACCKVACRCYMSHDIRCISHAACRKLVAGAVCTLYSHVARRCCMLHVARCMLHVSCLPKRVVACCRVQFTCCSRARALRTAVISSCNNRFTSRITAASRSSRYRLRVVYVMLHVARCIVLFHVARCRYARAAAAVPTDGGALAHARQLVQTGGTRPHPAGVSARRRPKGFPPARPLCALCSVLPTRRGACSLLHAACRTLSVGCMLHAACCLLHVACCMPHAVCRLHVACRMLSVGCMLHAARCLSVACCMPHALLRACVRVCVSVCVCLCVCCMLYSHVASSLLYVACSTVACCMFHSACALHATCCLLHVTCSILSVSSLPHTHAAVCK